MNFIEKLLGLLSSGFTFIGEMIWKIVEFISKPLTYLYYFLDGVFYFISSIFQVVVKIVMIFVALFQFFFALVSGFTRTLYNFLSFTVDTSYINFPSASYQGFLAVIEVIEPTGLMTIVPLIFTALVWFFFVYKVLGLLGGSGSR